MSTPEKVTDASRAIDIAAKYGRDLGHEVSTEDAIFASKQDGLWLVIFREVEKSPYLIVAVQSDGTVRGHIFP